MVPWAPNYLRSGYKHPATFQKSQLCHTAWKSSIFLQFHLQEVYNQHSLNNIFTLKNDLNPNSKMSHERN